MIRAECQFILPVQPQEAFALLSDPIRDPEWLTACQRTALLDGAVGPGCRYEITFEFLSRVMDFVVQINQFEPGHCSRFTTLTGPFHYVGDYRYTAATGGGTNVHWTFDVEPGDYFGLTPHTLVRKFLVSQVETDAARLAEQLTLAGANAASIGPTGSP